MKKKKNIILSLLTVLTVIIITGGVTYAFFSYIRAGTTDNVITTGSITFLYTEVDGLGSGISIENAFPMEDDKGKLLSKTNEYFDFKVASRTTNTTVIPYEVTARKSNDSGNIDEYIRIYLTKGETEEEVLLDNYNSLLQTSNVSELKYTEKIIYTGKVPANQTDYEETFRLRIWIDEDTRFDTNNLNNKKFKLTVNVYTTAKVVTEEDIASESSTEIIDLSADSTSFTAVEGEKYDYETKLPIGTTSTTINVDTENSKATVNIEKIDDLASSNNVKRLATSKKIQLNQGDNYFKLTVISENKKVSNEYILKINVESSASVMDSSYSLSIGRQVTAIDGSKWHVLEDSFEGMETVVLLSDYNLNDDGTYNTECGGNINSNYRCNPMAFDSDKINVYDEDASNNIGYFVKNIYAPIVTKILPGTTTVTVPTAEQIAIADGQIFDGTELTLNNSWLKTTNYWTKNSGFSRYFAWFVRAEGNQLDYGYVHYTHLHGVRPVITTLKSNLLVG